MTVKEGLGEINKWKPALTDEEWHRANLVVLDDTLDDKLMCTLTSSRIFKISEYIKHFRPSHPKEGWTAIVWNKITPFRVNVFMWKVLHGAISVDSNIQRRGIMLPSKLCLL